MVLLRTPCSFLSIITIMWNIKALSGLNEPIKIVAYEAVDNLDVFSSLIPVLAVSKRSDR